MILELIEVDRPKTIGEKIAEIAASSRWTRDEIKLLESLYPLAPREQILVALPHHSWKSIYIKAFRLRIKRQTYGNGESPLKGKKRPELSGPNNGMWGKHHTEEARDKQRKAWKYEKHFTPEARRKMGESRKGEKNPFYGKHWSDDEKQALRNQLKGRHLHSKTEWEKGQHISLATEFKKGNVPPYAGKHLPKELRAKLSNANKGNRPSLETRRKSSESHQKLWDDPIFVAKQMKARGIRPTKAELKMEHILNDYFPQFKYNGDGRLGIILRRLIPDYIDINGKKQIIELFGDYWHSQEVIGNRWQGTELGRIMAYSSIGFRCLIIWEHELQDEQKVINKIRQFVKATK